MKGIRSSIPAFGDRPQSTYSLFKHVDGVNFQIQQFCDAELGINSFCHTRAFIEGSKIHILPDFSHCNRICNIFQRNPQSVGHILFGVINFHRPVQLQTRHQISGSAYPAHPRNDSMRRMHPVRVANAHLQSVQSTNFNMRLGSSRQGIYRRGNRQWNATHTHSQIGMHRDIGYLRTGLCKGDRSGKVERQ